MCSPAVDQYVRQFSAKVSLVFGQCVHGARPWPVQCVGHFSVPANTGRAFAQLTKDHNPIHMSSVLARLLYGFKRDLAHGMWAMARALSLIGGVDPKAPVRLDCAFKGPIYMENDARVESSGECVFVHSGANARPSIVARWRNVDPHKELLVGVPDAVPRSHAASAACETAAPPASVLPSKL